MTRLDELFSDGEKKLFGRAKMFVTDTVEGAKELHEEIKDKGGYAAAVTRKFEEVEKYVEIKALRTRKKFCDELYTDGKFDYEKAKECLSDKGKVVAAYGEETVAELTKIVEQGATFASKGKDALDEQMNKIFPTKEELETKYAGIGGMSILRSHYDAVLTYHDDMDDTIPNEEDLKAQILSDIKVSGSENYHQLHLAYANDAQIFFADEDTAERIRPMLDRIDVIKKYTDLE